MSKNHKGKIRIDDNTYSSIRKKINELLRTTEYLCPVDLFHIAKLQHINEIILQPLIPEGCIQPIENAFRVFLRYNGIRKIVLGNEKIAEKLSARQRFILAHEIIHTFFFSFKDSMAFARDDAPKGVYLENICQKGAGDLLVPELVLRSRINNRTPPTAELIEELSMEFEASPEVVIQQINFFEELKKQNYAIIFYEEKESNVEWEVKAFCYNDYMLPFILKPTRNSILKLPPYLEKWTANVWEYSKKIEDGKLYIRRKPYSGSTRRFFIEYELVNEMFGKKD